MKLKKLLTLTLALALAFVLLPINFSYAGEGEDPVPCFNYDGAGDPDFESVYYEDENDEDGTEYNGYVETVEHILVDGSLPDLTLDFPVEAATGFDAEKIKYIWSYWTGEKLVESEGLGELKDSLILKDATPDFVTCRAIYVGDSTAYDGVGCEVEFNITPKLNPTDSAFEGWNRKDIRIYGSGSYELDATCTTISGLDVKYSWYHETYDDVLDDFVWVKNTNTDAKYTIKNPQAYDTFKCTVTDGLRVKDLTFVFIDYEGHGSNGVFDTDFNIGVSSEDKTPKAFLDDLKNNKAVNFKLPEGLCEAANTALGSENNSNDYRLNVKLTKAESSNHKLTYSVDPEMKIWPEDEGDDPTQGEEPEWVEPEWETLEALEYSANGKFSKVIKFRLPVPSDWEDDFIMVEHKSNKGTIIDKEKSYKVQSETIMGKTYKFVIVETTSFSDFVLSTSETNTVEKAVVSTPKTVLVAESPITGDYLMTICWLILISGLLAGSSVMLTKNKAEEK